MRDWSASSRQVDRRPSHTAVKIARGLVFLGEDPVKAKLLPPGAAQTTSHLLLEAGLLKPWMVSLYGHPWFQRLVSFFERATINGQMTGSALRKRFVDDETRAGIADGATQVLVVGSGLDTLCERLAPEFPDVTFVEVDRPATANLKRRAIADMGANRPNLHILDIDLASAALAEALAAVLEWDRGARSVVVAEGVLMYIHEAEVVTFLNSIRSGCGAGTRLVFTYLAIDRKGRPHVGRLSGLMRLTLRVIGEPLHWGTNPEHLEGFLEEHGFRVLSPRDRYDLRRRYLEPAGLGDMTEWGVEFLSVAEVTPA